MILLWICQQQKNISFCKKKKFSTSSRDFFFLFLPLMWKTSSKFCHHYQHLSSQSVEVEMVFSAAGCDFILFHFRVFVIIFIFIVVAFCLIAATADGDGSSLVVVRKAKVLPSFMISHLHFHLEDFLLFSLFSTMYKRRRRSKAEKWQWRKKSEKGKSSSQENFFSLSTFFFIRSHLSNGKRFSSFLLLLLYTFVPASKRQPAPKSDFTFPLVDWLVGWQKLCEIKITISTMTGNDDDVDDDDITDECKLFGENVIEKRKENLLN